MKHRGIAQAAASHNICRGLLQEQLVSSETKFYTGLFQSLLTANRDFPWTQFMPMNFLRGALWGKNLPRLFNLPLTMMFMPQLSVQNPLCLGRFRCLRRRSPMRLQKTLITYASQ